MNPNLLPLSLIAAVGLLIAPQTSEAAATYTTYTFVVDSTSCIGSGSFTIVLPDDWPGNIGQTTLIPASSFRGFFVRGDKWTAISVSLNEPQPRPGSVEQPNTAQLSVASKKSASLKILTGGTGLAPVDAVASLLGLPVSPSPSGVAPSEVSRQRRSRLLETNILLKGGWYRSRQKPGLTSGTFSTDRVVDPATPVPEFSCASPPPLRPLSAQDGLVPKSTAQQSSGAGAHTNRFDPKCTRVCHDGVLRAVRQMEIKGTTAKSTRISAEFFRLTPLTIAC